MHIVSVGGDGDLYLMKVISLGLLSLKEGSKPAESLSSVLKALKNSFFPVYLIFHSPAKPNTLTYI